MAPAAGIRVPASSANLGPGFDALGMALSLHLTAIPGEPAAPPGHPATEAFTAAGGRGPLAVASDIPPGRGLGFSGAARAAGALAALVQAGASLADACAPAFDLASRLEGHADNVAASVYGGVVATAGGHVVRVPLAIAPAVVVWVPAATTSTAGARARLPERVPLADATFNLARTALLVAALAAGDVAALRVAAEDRLHQDRRLAPQPDSRHAIEAALDTGAWCAWLSGSGPAVAALADHRTALLIAAHLPPAGEARVVTIDTQGAVLAERYPERA